MSITQPRCYAVHLWGVDPLFWVHAKLFISDVLALSPHAYLPDTFFLLNHPISRVEVMGYIVSVDVRSRLTTYHVDDGSGVISCVVWSKNNREEPQFPLELGTLVKARGRVTSYREARQITITSIGAERINNAELLWWLEVSQLKHQIYSHPLVIESEYENWNQGQKRPGEEVNGMALQRLKIDGPMIDKVTNECDFQRYIRQFLLNEGIRSFKFKDLCAISALVSMATKLLVKKEDRGEGEGEVEPGRVVALLGRCIESLCESGYLWLAQRESDIYECITLNDHVIPAILTSLKSAPE
eukprot:Ihof_evm4s184 gene=Ihof_evmTU4s184